MGLSIMVSPNRSQMPQTTPLVKQTSLYNLSLNDVQNQLGIVGKTMNPLNIDELLNNTVAVEGTQVNGNPQFGDSTNFLSPYVQPFPGTINLCGALGGPTVNDLWMDTGQQEQNVSVLGSVQNQPTLGEMTLEDFLLRAGAINLCSQNSVSDPLPIAAVDPTISVTQPVEWLQYHVVAAQQQQQQLDALGSNIQSSCHAFIDPAASTSYTDNQLAFPMAMAGTTSSDSQATPERKRKFSDEVMDKNTERRQRRMIKNRESAARSRQRKQAYTNQLEQAVRRLKKTNHKLKKAAELEIQLDLLAESKYQLRRTSSATF